MMRSRNAGRPLDALDRVVVLYLGLPVGIFLAGWLQPWAAIPLLLCLGYGLYPLAAPGGTHDPRGGLSRWQVAIAIAIGCAWTVCGGTGHWVFANADWHIRDAVLHDLVTGAWPVGYGAEGGGPTLLRAPLGYYLPAALVGKAAGLAAAHVGLALWTATGATLFLLQVLSHIPRKVGPVLAGVAVIVAFSGLDAVGTLLRVPGAAAHWDVTNHLEWWAARYQYSSMTTQLFWVPNHALGAWLGIGLLYRGRGADADHFADSPQTAGGVDLLLPMIVVAVALWSPLAALGLVPFVLWRVWETAMRERSNRLFHPRVWAPAMAVGLVIAEYLTLDTGGVPAGWTIGRQGFGLAAIAGDLGSQAEFVLLEAGLIGVVILSIHRSAAVMLALCVLAILPVARFGAANDFVMRVSIPSLTVLAIGACLALFAAPAAAAAEPIRSSLRIKKAALAGLLLVGAVTPFQEFARAAALERWPVNLDATLIDAACGIFPAHYVARLRDQPITHLLRAPHALPIGRAGAVACENPAVSIEHRRARNLQ
jgi:hypothetical protein